MLLPRLRIVSNSTDATGLGPTDESGHVMRLLNLRERREKYTTYSPVIEEWVEALP